jgi:predicted amidohydrolase YtcJ
MAVEGDKILYVGVAAGADALQGDCTQLLDLAGNVVMPGFSSAMNT